METWKVCVSVLGSRPRWPHKDSFTGRERGREREREEEIRRQMDILLNSKEVLCVEGGRDREMERFTARERSRER